MTTYHELERLERAAYKESVKASREMALAERSINSKIRKVSMIGVCIAFAVVCTIFIVL